MAEKSDAKQIILDNRFFVPPGVIDVRQAGDEQGEFFYDPADLQVDGPIFNTPESPVPMPPTSYEIVEQRVRISSDGRAVVDVLLEFPDIDGVETIEVRLTTT